MMLKNSNVNCGRLIESENKRSMCTCWRVGYLRAVFGLRRLRSKLRALHMQKKNVLLGLAGQTVTNFCSCHLFCIDKDMRTLP